MTIHSDGMQRRKTSHRISKEFSHTNPFFTPLFKHRVNGFKFLCLLLLRMCITKYNNFWMIQYERWLGAGSIWVLNWAGCVAQYGFWDPGITKSACGWIRSHPYSFCQWQYCSGHNGARPVCFSPWKEISIQQTRWTEIGQDHVHC